MEYPDFSDSFVTDVVFPSRKEMVNWVQQVGRGMRPKNTLKNLKERFPNNASIIQTLYNFRNKNKVEVMAGREMQNATTSAFDFSERKVMLIDVDAALMKEDFENVSSDGTCGFRRFMIGMGFDKETGGYK
ncbi:hypothetical protein IFM89_003720 [Coptis chinensis]|uniref:Uncharacterized protein n=1 Tax=Coptis chinensis TaxID=261450 RepID=A0A835HY98_9MAGN|nr:hypothetical protein IFM89_003720 [Coptis chinensis]